MKANHGLPSAGELGALGIVYGDIGTSVLYAFRECLAHSGRHQEEILGILSLIIWTLTLLVTGKYLTFVMRADNQGEGGILALLSLAFPESVNEAPKSRISIAMIAVGLIGAAFSMEMELLRGYFGALCHRGVDGCRPVACPF